jgi:hypothetical protein
VPLSEQHPICPGIKQSKKTVLGLLVPEDKGNIIFRNFGTYSLAKIASLS